MYVLVSRGHTLHKRGRVWSNAYARVVLFPRNRGEHEYANFVAAVPPRYSGANHNHDHARVLMCCVDKLLMDIAEPVRKAAALLGYDELRDEQLKALCTFVDGRDVFFIPANWLW